MRKLIKGLPPQVLVENAAQWLEEYLDNPGSKTSRYRYRDDRIKAALTTETAWKCVYCESKIGHNTPGDIEHKVPTAKAQQLHFEWINLTTACTECNRRKRDYYQTGAEFIDPYVDDVDVLIEHHGPFVGWQTGHARAEISVRILEFADESRKQLVLRKIEAIEAFCETLERYASEDDDMLKALHLKRLNEFRALDSEYSAMLIAVGNKKGVPT